MNSIGKVNHSGTLWQPDHIPARRKYKNLLRCNIGFNGFYNVLYIIGVLLRFQQLPDPRQALIQRILTLHADLVFPVRRNTVFRSVMHIPGTDLHFKRHAFFIQHSGMQRLIHVLLGSRDIVLKAIRDRPQHIMDDPQNVVALRYSIYNNAHRINIVNLIKGAALNIHLTVDAIDAFHPPIYLCGHMFFFQPGLNSLNNIAQERFPIFFAQG